MTRFSRLLRRIRWGIRRTSTPDRTWFVGDVLRRHFVGQALPPQEIRLPVKRVIFVCHGNIMRSAFAREYWEQSVSKVPDRVLPPSISAGTHAKSGNYAHPLAAASARHFGVSLEEHRAVSIATLELGGDDLIVSFDCENSAAIRRRLHRNSGAQSVLLGDLGAFSGTLEAEIRDPWGTSEIETTKTFQEIATLVDVLASRL